MSSMLTSKEKEIFELLLLNKSTKDVANVLCISEKTVRNHISNVIQKMNVKTRFQAIIKLIKIGELNLE